MADEDINVLFGQNDGLNISFLENSNTQAATTAAQTIAIAKQLIGEHNSSDSAHITQTASPERIGLVQIDPELTSDETYAVPNSAAIKKFLFETVDALTYAGQIDIDEGATTEVHEKRLVKLVLDPYTGEYYEDQNASTYTGEIEDVYETENGIIITNPYTGEPIPVMVEKAYVDKDNQTFPFLVYNKIYRGSVFLLSSTHDSYTGETGRPESYIEYTHDNHTHIYTNGDYLIANTDIDPLVEKKFSDFDWYNSQDYDTVKLKEYQTVENKILENTYFDGTFVPTYGDETKENDETYYERIKNGENNIFITKNYVDTYDFLKPNKETTSNISFVNGKLYTRPFNSTAEFNLKENVNSTQSLEVGTQYYWTGNFMWIGDNKHKDPAAFDYEDEEGNILHQVAWDTENFVVNPTGRNDESGISEQVMISENDKITLSIGSNTEPIKGPSNKSGTVRLYSQKTGLVIDGTNIKKGNGPNPQTYNETDSSGKILTKNTFKTISINYYKNMFYGFHDKATMSADELQELINGIGKTGHNFYKQQLTASITQLNGTRVPSTGVTPSDATGYFYIIYPKSFTIDNTTITLKDLSNIKSAYGASGAEQQVALNSFKKLDDLVITNPTGLDITYNVYLASPSGTWTNSFLKLTTLK